MAMPSLSGAVAVHVFPPSRVVDPVAAVGDALEVHLPPARLRVRLRAGRRDDGAVGELHRLVLDRAEDAVGQASCVAPLAAAVAARAQHPPPLLRRRPNLVEEHQRPAARLEQYRVPRRVPRAVELQSIGDFDARRPSVFLLPGHPDAHVGAPLARPAEPRRHELVRRCLDDRRGVHRRIRPALVDELLEQDRRVLGVRCEGAEDADEKKNGCGLHGCGFAENSLN